MEALIAITGFVGLLVYVVLVAMPLAFAAWIAAENRNRLYLIWFVVVLVFPFWLIPLLLLKPQPTRAEAREIASKAQDRMYDPKPKAPAYFAKPSGQ